jgi:hypothetical protein
MRRYTLFFLTVLATAVPAVPAAQASDPCHASLQAHPHPFVHAAASTRVAVTIPDITHPGHTFTGDVFAPNSAHLGGQRPTAIVMHGIDANPCSIRWIDRYLAGRGWVVIDAYRRPTLPRNGAAHANAALQTTLHMNAIRSAVAFLRGPANPFAARVNRARLVLIGHSLGANAETVLQSQIPNVQAFVALDNLKRYGANDPGSALICQGTPSQQALPRVPALGFASDMPCLDTPSNTDPDLKLEGYDWWREYKQPAMELVLRGFHHTDFSDGGTNAQLKIVAHYMFAWIERYQLGVAAAQATLLDKHPFSPTQPIDDLLSTEFHSAVFMPGVIDCPLLSASCLP